MRQRSLTNKELMGILVEEVRTKFVASGVGRPAVKVDRRSVTVQLLAEHDGTVVVTASFAIRQRPRGDEFVRAALMVGTERYVDGHVTQDDRNVEGRTFVLNAHPLYDQRAAFRDGVDRVVAQIVHQATLADDLSSCVHRVASELEESPDLARHAVETVLEARPDLAELFEEAIAVVKARLSPRMPSFSAHSRH